MTESIIKRCPDCGLISEDDALASCPSDGAPLRPYDPADEFVGRVLQGRFIVKRLLGRGGMGAVYLARQLSVDRDVAVKILRVDVAEDTGRVRRFLREAKATSRLRSPHTVTVYDFGQADDGTLFLVMEHLEGRTLQHRLKSDGPMSVQGALELADGLADSLAEAHAASIVHRDLKPANIFLARQGEHVDFSKVLDFGIAQAQAVDGGATITASNVIVGSVAYMSPEMIEGRQVDARADVYAVGIILWECLVGRRPFDGDTRFQLMQQHLHAVPPSLTEVLIHSNDPHLPALSALVDRCLAKRRELRPADGREMRRLVAGLLAVARTDEVLVGAASAPMGLAHTIDARPPEALPAAGGELSDHGSSSAPHEPLQTGADTRPKPPAGAPPGSRRAHVMWLAASAVVAAGAFVAGSQLLGTGLETAAEPATAPESGDTGVAPAAGREPAATLAGGAAQIVVQDDTDAAAAVAGPVTVRIVSQPAGAEVVADGAVLGITPHALELPRGHERTRLTLRLVGHRDHSFDITPDRDDQVRLELERLPDALPAASAGAPTPAKKVTRPATRGTVDDESAPGRTPAAKIVPTKRKDEAAEVLLD